MFRLKHKLQTAFLKITQTRGLTADPVFELIRRRQCSLTGKDICEDGKVEETIKWCQ